MYDAREKALRDQQWQLNSAFREGQEKGEREGREQGEREGRIEGKIEGEIKLIRTLQGILRMPLSPEQELHAMTLEQLEAITSRLQEQLRNRASS
jgi:predicted transposase YdaD